MMELLDFLLSLKALSHHMFIAVHCTIHSCNIFFSGIYIGVKFIIRSSDGINSGVYDERDLERLRSNDDHVLNFIKHQKGEIEKAAAMIDQSLKFRKQHELNGMYTCNLIMMP